MHATCEVTFEIRRRPGSPKGGSFLALVVTGVLARVGQESDECGLCSVVAAGIRDSQDYLERRPLSQKKYTEEATSPHLVTPLDV